MLQKPAALTSGSGKNLGTHTKKDKTRSLDPENNSACIMYLNVRHEILKLLMKNSVRYWREQQLSESVPSSSGNNKN